jgi:predicted metal-dependent enzyme (double-stranded beta helix superfamily)
MTRESTRLQRACAAELIMVIETYQQNGDAGALRDGLLGAIRPLVQCPDLFSLGTKRPGNHIDNSKYLYYDGQLSVTLDEFPNGKFIPPHDHGVWEALVLCAGALQHTSYKRIDDGSIEGRAELRVAEETQMNIGEIAMVVPPSDIHSFKAMAEGTFVITIVGGEYAHKRHYYNPGDDTYVIRTPKALRESGALM